MQTILVTGANGFVGQYLVDQLLGKNYKVIATGKGICRHSISAPDYHFESLDVTEETNIKLIFEKYKPAIVVHCGAMSKPDDCEQNREEAFRTNVTGTECLLKVAAVYMSHFIFLSTDFIFSGEKGFYKEEDEPAPVNYYGETKMLAEAKVIHYPYDWSIVRTVLVYGNPRGGRHNILTNVAKALQNGQTLNIFSDQLRTPTYVEDLVDGIIRIIEKKATGVYHLSGEDVLTPYQMACAVADYLKLNKELIKEATEDSFQQPAKRPAKTGFDLTKAKNDLGYKPRSFIEGLKKTFEG